MQADPGARLAQQLLDPCAQGRGRVGAGRGRVFLDEAGERTAGLFGRSRTGEAEQFRQGRTARRVRRAGGRGPQGVERGGVLSLGSGPAQRACHEDEGVGRNRRLRGCCRSLVEYRGGCLNRYTYREVDTMPTARFFFDAGSGAVLWAAPADQEVWEYPVDLDRLPISRGLRDGLSRLVARYDTSLNWDYPPGPGTVA